MNEYSATSVGVKSFVHIGLVVENLEETLRFLRVLAVDPKG
jgi:hypothetical protein